MSYIPYMQSTTRESLAAAPVIRRLFPAALAACCFTMAGCASPEQVCDMKADFREEIPMSGSGEKTIRWQFGAEVAVGYYGMTYCDDSVCRVDLKGKPPRFSDVCGLARFGHELAHAMNARHE